MEDVETVARTDATVRRGELSAFLRSRRERITPADVGLPAGARRRTPGLRREEVAQLAGVGVTWYTWLEQGRPIKASVQVLDAVAGTLRLDVAEREHLYRLAGVPSVAPPETGYHVAPEVRTILDHLDPLPAAVYNARWDALAWNAAYALIFPGVASSPQGQCNVIWHVFTRPECCCPFAEPEREMPRLVASLRPAYGRHIGEPGWVAFVQGMCAASPSFAALWARQDVLVSDTHVKRIRHADVGEMRLVATRLALDAAEMRINVYTPADQVSGDLMARLRTVPFPRVGCPTHGYVRYRNPVLGGDPADDLVRTEDGVWGGRTGDAAPTPAP